MSWSISSPQAPTHIAWRLAATTKTPLETSISAGALSFLFAYPVSLLEATKGRASPRRWKAGGCRPIHRASRGPAESASARCEWLLAGLGRASRGRRLPEFNVPILSIAALISGRNHRRGHGAGNGQHHLRCYRDDHAHQPAGQHERRRHAGRASETGQEAWLPIGRWQCAAVLGFLRQSM